MSNKANLYTAPHVKSTDSTRSIMLDVVIALLPTTFFGIYHFGMKAALIILVSIITCLLTEYVYQSLMNQPVTISDGSALVTGLLLALNLPSTVPLWIPFIGSIFAILIVKQLYGGLGQNFMNPALAARCFLLISFGSRMSTFALDGVSGATPLAMLKEGETVNTASLFVGNIAGCIGEVSSIAILIGAAYLLLKRVISIRIPFTYIITFALFMLIFSGRGFDLNYLGAQIFGGGLLLGAFFMATDYASSPVTPVGKIVFGVVLGILTGIFRLFGGTAEGVSYAIIITNLLVPLIEKVTVPVVFGREGIKREK
ncbi:MAG TPA: RnfABCDGE type electron transport complex subunit D [Candidatus Merdenecus merdavium]|nr:RnfABCDGE type electron transport complex subunit D [Candidatus Merdenecus merdavium]